ncbi:GntR family transcriptional regulator [Cellulomonas humilata]|uniref:DNA-binding GntR family transcriptional regulator n=1 Tax=Cellulomonas humilata TaxID=144055 RepID=A0ABU0EI43_9CELL|nr:GntR family transcriptional regulator [Cellulomonas humilata]MDQ0374944.1 DNA-binding GntR family transcriptional regulator [Cellulomonas humilata]
MTDQLVETVRSAIVKGDLLPGEAVREADLAKTLGVSRTPIRQVLQRLAEIGLVRIDVGRRYTVTPVEPEQLQQIVVVLAELFGLATRLAVANLTDEDREWVAQAGRAASTADPTAPTTVAPGFFDLVLGRCGNAVLVESVDRYRVHVTRMRTLVGGAPEVEARRMAAILAEVPRRDGDALAALARDVFLEHGTELVATVAERTQAEQPGVAQ